MACILIGYPRCPDTCLVFDVLRFGPPWTFKLVPMLRVLVCSWTVILLYFFLVYSWTSYLFDFSTFLLFYCSPTFLLFYFSIPAGFYTFLRFYFSMFPRRFYFSTFLVYLWTFLLFCFSTFLLFY